MQHLAARFADQAMTRIRQVKEAGREAGARDVIAAILAPALPADDERRTFAVLNAAYFALTLTDPALATAPLVKNTNAVIDVIAAQLRTSQAADDTPAYLDPDAEALSLLAMSSGLGNSVLAGQSSAERAQAVIDYHLDRLFPVSRPALRRTPATQPASDPGVRVWPYDGGLHLRRATRLRAHGHPCPPARGYMLSAVSPDAAGSAGRAQSSPGMCEHVDGRLSRPTSRTPGQWEGPPCPNHRVHFPISPAFDS
jgi:hypothetical protein